MSLPEDFAAAAKGGGLRASVLDTYCKLASGGFLTSWLVKSLPAFRDRILAARLFFFTVWGVVPIASGEDGGWCGGGVLLCCGCHDELPVCAAAAGKLQPPASVCRTGIAAAAWLQLLLLLARDPCMRWHALAPHCCCVRGATQ